ncbi:MAG: hypothetical protein U0T55_01430 [Buchnera aphidicola (Kaburagia rhusicola ensigallis)]
MLNPLANVTLSHPNKKTNIRDPISCAGFNVKLVIGEIQKSIIKTNIPINIGEIILLTKKLRFLSFKIKITNINIQEIIISIVKSCIIFILLFGKKEKIEANSKLSKLPLIIFFFAQSLLISDNTIHILTLKKKKNQIFETEYKE